MTNSNLKLDFLIITGFIFSKNLGTFSTKKGEVSKIVKEACLVRVTYICC